MDVNATAHERVVGLSDMMHAVPDSTAMSPDEIYRRPDLTATLGVSFFRLERTIDITPTHL